MGMFKQLKDMKATVEAAPAMVQQARQLGAQAQQMAAAQQAAAQAQMAPFSGSLAGADASGPDFAPIAGVSLDLYVSICKGVAAFGNDQSKLVELAASHGVAAFSWDDAARGWSDRIKANPYVAKRYNQLYRQI